MKKLKYVLISLFSAILIVSLVVVVFFKLWSGWLTFLGNRFYLEDGELATGIWWLPDGTYYFNSSGVMQTGLVSIDENTFYFDSEGRMQTGFVTNGGITYYFDEEGRMQTGLMTISGDHYYFDSDGKMQTGFQVVDGKRYYFDSDGQAHIGWLQEDGWTYYGVSFMDGALAEGKWSLDGDGYYFHEGGHMATGEWELDDGMTYYFDSNGRFQYRMVSEETLSYSSASTTHSFPTSSGSYADYYYNVLQTTVTDCTSIDGRFDVAESFSGSPNGTWDFYIRTTDGVWRNIKQFTVSGQHADFSVTFDDPCSFDAYVYVHYSHTHPDGWHGRFYARIGCEYLDYNFGPCSAE